MKMFLTEGNILLRHLNVACVLKLPVASFCTKINPGTQRRLNITEDTDQVDLDNLDYEANFEALGSSHKQHLKEMEKMKEKLQYDIVKRKYFNTKHPNFLTWHDKEQIRLLHRKDPTEWNIMKLHEGFPALPEIIKKIIKSKWRMKDADQMRKHDETVRENWRKLKNNEFKELPIHLITHLRNFSDRQFNYHNYDNIEDHLKIEYKPELTCTEFSDIISSYKELKEKNSKHIAIGFKNNAKQNELDQKKNTDDAEVNRNMLMKNKIKSHIEEDTFMIEPSRNNEPMTLSTLKTKLQSNLEKGEKVSTEDASIIELDWKDNFQKIVQTNTAVDQLDYTKYNTGKLMKVDEKKPMDYNHLIYPEKIKIPKKIMKKGCTYKLNDCFYASDGTFLYRVPGMI